VSAFPADKSILIAREVDEYTKAAGEGNKKKGPVDKSKDFRSFLMK